MPVTFSDDIEDEREGVINSNSFNPIYLDLKPIEMVEV